MYSFPSISANWFTAPTALLCSRDTVFTRPREDVCASSYDGSAGCVQPLDGTAIKLHQTELSKNGSQSHRLRPGRRYDMDQSGFLPDQVNILLFSITEPSYQNESSVSVSRKRLNGFENAFNTKYIDLFHATFVTTISLNSTIHSTL